MAPVIPWQQTSDTDKKTGSLWEQTLVVVLDALFRGSGPLHCEDAADADDDGRASPTDAVQILIFLFQGGPPPPSPGPEEGDIAPDVIWACSQACREVPPGAAAAAGRLRDGS